MSATNNGSVLIRNKTKSPKKGNNGNHGKAGRSGRKSRAEEMGLMRLLNECWPLAERKKCIRKLARRASDGNIEAARLLLAYAYGKPKEMTDLDVSSQGCPLITEIIVEYAKDSSKIIQLNQRLKNGIAHDSRANLTAVRRFSCQA